MQSILPTHTSQPGPAKGLPEFECCSTIFRDSQSETEKNQPKKNPPPHRTDQTDGKQQAAFVTKKCYWWWLNWCRRRDQTAKSRGSCWHRSAGSAGSQPVIPSLIASSPPHYPANPLKHPPLPGSGSPTCPCQKAQLYSFPSAPPGSQRRGAAASRPDPSRGHPP